MISSFSSLYQPERRNTWGDSPHYPRSSSSWVPPAPDHRKPSNKISCVSSQHDTYILQYWSTEIFIHLFTCRSPPGVGAGGTGQTVAGKKIIRDISHFWRISARWKICPWECFFYERMFSTIFTHWPISVIGRRCDKSSVSIGTIVAPSKRRIVFCPVSFPPPVPDTNFRGVMFKESSSFANVLCLEFAILEINDTNPNFIQTPGVLVDNDMVKVQA